MELDLHPQPLAVCRLEPDVGLPDWALRAGQPLTSITRTADELSVVAPQAAVPPGLPAERGWRALEVRGPLPFHLVGVLAALAAPLALARVPVFVVSTHDTDWLLVREERLGEACAALETAGHPVHR